MMEIKLQKVLSREMKMHSLSASFLAKVTGIPRTTIHEWQNGRKPSSRNLHHLLVLANYFKISLNELLFDQNVHSENETETLFMSTFEKGSEKFKLIVLKIK